MSDRLQEHLSRAFAEASRSAARNSAFALKAEHEGYPQLARLFRTLAEAKSVHARRHLLMMRGKIGSSEENLEEALQQEIIAVEITYPPMIGDAKEAGKAVKKALGQCRRTDEEQIQILSDAKDDQYEEGQREYVVCQICGHIHRGVVPDRCPVCQAVPGRFKEVV